VIGFATIRAACVLSAAVLTGCNQPAASRAEPETAAAILDEATSGSAHLQIIGRNGQCFLRTSSSELPLKPKAPCFFLRRTGEVQVFSYEDAAADAVLIVAGTPATDADRKAWNLKPGDLCGTESQGVIRKKTAVSITGAVHSGGVYCKDQGVDEKEFWSFAHRSE
jgi:hypothetical protein